MTYFGLWITFSLALVFVEGLRTGALWVLYKIKQRAMEKSLDALKEQIEMFSNAQNFEDSGFDTFRTKSDKSDKTH